MFEDAAQFPHAAELERNWGIIRDEMVALRSTGFMAWPEKSLYADTGGWSTFGLYAFGQKQKENCALCPRTTALVEAIPGMVMAGFSRLAPGAHIKPHVGYDEYSRYVLRLHLALETNSGLRPARRGRNARLAGRQNARFLRRRRARSLESRHDDAHRAAARFQKPALPLSPAESRPEHRVRRFRRKRPLARAELAERMKWRFWKFTRFGRQPPPAGQSAKGADKR